MPMRLKRRHLHISAIGGLVFVTTLAIAYLAYLQVYATTFYPGVEVAGVHLNHLTPTQAKTLLLAQVNQRIYQPVDLQYNDQHFSLDMTKSAPEVSIEDSLAQAYQYGRSNNYWNNFRDQAQALFQHKQYQPQVVFKGRTFLNAQLASINDAIKKEPTDAQIDVQTFAVTESQNGLEMDRPLLQQQLTDYLTLKSPAPTTIPLKTAEPEVTTQAARFAAQALQRVKTQPLIITHESSKWTITDVMLYPLLNRSNTERASFNQEKIQAYIQTIADQIDQPAQDARFDFDGTRVQQFRPAQEGKQIDKDKTIALLEQALNQDSGHTLVAPVVVAQPKVTSASTNNFGIEALLSTGTSHFVGSIPNRIYNVGLAASRIHGTLVPPGGVFSFNQTVGDISAATGYKQAYVIKAGRTVLDDGGGVCQVSTTLFRAVLNAGLPIVDRTAHAYRVGYYEQGSAPGIDATVFYPTVDFKFKNDTANYLLIQTVTEGTDLTINIYGKSDGRQVSVSAPIITNVSPAPPELRQDDPTLPKGTVKQVDFAAAGANVTFKRTIIKEGQLPVSETYHSNYRPWQAIFLVGTKEN